MGVAPHGEPLRYRGEDVPQIVSDTETGATPMTRPVGGAAKRAFDLAVAVPATIALAPVMAGIALWVRREDGGPAIFRQQRVGADAPALLTAGHRNALEAAIGVAVDRTVRTLGFRVRV